MMIKLMRKSLFLGGLLAFFSLILASCDTGPQKQAISGTITFKGKPLDQGLIQFAPASPEIPTASGANIQNGKYAIPRDKGLLPGTYDVRISAPEAGTVAKEEAMPGEAGPPAKERIPAKYNANTTLKFEVKAGQGNTFDVTIP
jgi:hypothetical protein